MDSSDTSQPELERVASLASEEREPVTHDGASLVEAQTRREDISLLLRMGPGVLLWHVQFLVLPDLDD